MTVRRPSEREVSIGQIAHFTIDEVGWSRIQAPLGRSLSTEERDLVEASILTYIHSHQFESDTATALSPDVKGEVRPNSKHGDKTSSPLLRFRKKGHELILAWNATQEHEETKELLERYDTSRHLREYPSLEWTMAHLQMHLIGLKVKFEQLSEQRAKMDFAFAYHVQRLAKNFKAITGKSAPRVKSPNKFSRFTWAIEELLPDFVRSDRKTSALAKPDNLEEAWAQRVYRALKR